MKRLLFFPILILCATALLAADRAWQAITPTTAPASSDEMMVVRVDGANETPLRATLETLAPELAELASVSAPFIGYGIGDSTISPAQLTANALYRAWEDSRLVGTMVPHNLGLSGTAAYQWATNRLDTMFLPVRPLTGQKSFATLWLGLNDFGFGQTFEQITNSYLTLVSRLRTNGVTYVVGSELFGTNTAYLGTGLTNRTAFNLWVNSLTNNGVLDAVVPAHQLAVQMGGESYSGVLLDGLHQGVTYNRWLGTNLANIVAEWVPHRRSGAAFSGPVVIDSGTNGNPALRVKGGIRVTGTDSIYWHVNSRESEGFVARQDGVAGLTMVVYNQNVIRGNQDGTLSVYEGLVSTNGPGIYWKSNNTAATGSLLLMPDGMRYSRTNSTWVSF